MLFITTYYALTLEKRIVELPESSSISTFICGHSFTSFLQAASMVSWSPYLLYKRLTAFSYPLLVGYSIQCLINSFASLVVYLIRRVNLPQRSSILLSTTSLNKVIKYLKFSGLPSKHLYPHQALTAVSIVDAEHLKLPLRFFDYQMFDLLFLAHNSCRCLPISFDLNLDDEFLDG